MVQQTYGVAGVVIVLDVGALEGDTDESQMAGMTSRMKMGGSRM